MKKFGGGKSLKMSKFTYACAAFALACASGVATSAAAGVRYESGAAVAAARQDSQQGENKEAKKDEPEVKLSGGEREAAEKINKAKDAEAKLQAAAQFIKKYPQSAIRARVADAVVAAIAGVEDKQLQLSLAETFQAIFNQPGEAERVNQLLIAGYINANRAEDAFRLAETWLAKNPEDVDVLRNLAILASNEATRGNAGYVEKGRQFGQKAIELIEADKRPSYLEADKWEAYKKTALPALYREVGVLSMRAGDVKATREALEKAVELKSTDPAVYLVLSDLANQEYQKLATEYRATEGAEQEAVFKKVEAQLDKVIELYAQALAHIDGNAQYQQAKPQLMQDLESYYKFRHKGSTDGMQQLIDKYKTKPAAN